MKRKAIRRLRRTSNPLPPTKYKIVFDGRILTIEDMKKMLTEHQENRAVLIKQVNQLTPEIIKWKNGYADLEARNSELTRQLNEARKGSVGELNLQILRLKEQCGQLQRKLSAADTNAQAARDRYKQVVDFHLAREQRWYIRLWKWLKSIDAKCESGDSWIPKARNRLDRRPAP